MIATGFNKGMLLRTVPIKTVGLSPFQKYRAWLFQRRRVVLEEPCRVPKPEGGYYILPKGFEFDGGSIPRWLLVVFVLLVMGEIMPPSVLIPVMIGLLIDSFGLMLLAFAVHDYSVRYGMLINEDGEIEKVANVTAANRIMRRTNFATNDMIIIGLVAHLAVMLGAWWAWISYRNGRRKAVDWRTLDYGIDVERSV